MKRGYSTLRWSRWLNRLYAKLNGYFWKPCPICHQMFGGHEAADESVASGPFQEIQCRHWLNGIETAPVDAYYRQGKLVCWRCGECAKDINMQWSAP